MAKTQTLVVNPALIRWARETAGIRPPQAAKKLGIKPEKLALWESSEARPTARQLERIADVYKRPLASFFLSGPPSEAPLPIDFRVLRSDTERELTAPSLFAARRARWLQKVFEELTLDLGQNAPQASARFSVGDSPSEAAAIARRLLGISPEVQFSWRDPRTALRNWRAAVEQVGALVFQFSMPIEEIRGFSLSGDVPAIVLNSKDAPVARVFTLFHEWAHLLVGTPGICLPDEFTKVLQDVPVEVFCNAFAGNLLVPRDILLNAAGAAARADTELNSIVGLLSESFSVSRFVLLRRLLDVRFLDRRLYSSTLRKWESDRALGPMKRKGRGGPSPARKAISELGPTFVSRVLMAHERGAIGYSQVADYLSIRLKHLNRVHQLLSSV